MPRKQATHGDERKATGRPTTFGPVYARTSLTLTEFPARVLEAAAERVGKPAGTVVDLLLRKFGGSVSTDDFAFGDADCGDAKKLTE
jgi:hypothetical protein